MKSNRNSGLRQHRERAQFRPPLPTYHEIGWLFVTDDAGGREIVRIESNGRHTRSNVVEDF